MVGKVPEAANVCDIEGRDVKSLENIFVLVEKNVTVKLTCPGGIRFGAIGFVREFSIRLVDNAKSMIGGTACAATWFRRFSSLKRNNAVQMLQLTLQVICYNEKHATSDAAAQCDRKQVSFCSVDAINYPLPSRGAIATFPLSLLLERTCFCPQRTFSSMVNTAYCCRLRSAPPGFISPKSFFLFVRANEIEISMEFLPYLLRNSVHQSPAHSFIDRWDWLVTTVLATWSFGSLVLN